MGVNTFKHKVAFTANGDKATLRLPAAYDVIQIQFHPAAGQTAAAGDLMLIEGVDEDDETIVLPGGSGAGGAFLLNADQVLQFSWKGPAVKLTYTEVTAALNTTVKVKTFMENSGDTDTGSGYPTALAAAAGNPTRTLRG